MKPRMVIVALAALGGVAFTTGGACAMPNGIPQAGQIAGASANVEHVRWVCPPRAALSDEEAALAVPLARLRSAAPWCA